MSLTLAQLVEQAAAREEPGFNDHQGPRPGGVDPLGLRQINFQLMDEVFPGVNNVARHVRPFVVVAWAWRRAAQLALSQGLSPAPVELLRDFVDRIEVIYAWSQFLRDLRADLPGREVLASLFARTSVPFHGVEWESRRESRRYSTAFSAPINYGPALRTLGWLEVADDGSGALRATERATPALDALEAQMAPFLSHPSFSILGPVDVLKADVEIWGEAWRLDRPTDVEKAVAAELLAGDAANPRRANGVALALAAAAALSERDTGSVRAAMCGPPTNFASGPALAESLHMWRKVQVRQVLRLALEALFAWTIDRLGRTPRSTASLVKSVLEAPGVRPAATVREWLERPAGVGPTDQLEALEAAIRTLGRQAVPAAVQNALAFCLAEAPPAPESYESSERLPLAMAANQAARFSDDTPPVFLRHVFESWLFGQHTYWSVGRGLADARSGGKRLLRLRIVMDEGGWVTTPGATSPRPLATADRLETILALAEECDLLEPSAP